MWCYTGKDHAFGMRANATAALHNGRNNMDITVSCEQENEPECNASRLMTSGGLELQCEEKTNSTSSLPDSDDPSLLGVLSGNRNVDWWTHNWNSFPPSVGSQKLLWLPAIVFFLSNSAPTKRLWPHPKVTLDIKQQDHLVIPHDADGHLWSYGSQSGRAVAQWLAHRIMIPVTGVQFLSTMNIRWRKIPEAVPGHPSPTRTVQRDEVYACNHAHDCHGVGRPSSVKLTNSAINRYF